MTRPKQAKNHRVHISYILNLYEYGWAPIGILDEQDPTFVHRMRNWIRRNTQLIHNKDIQMLHTKPLVLRFIFSEWIRLCQITNIILAKTSVLVLVDGFFCKRFVSNTLHYKALSINILSSRGVSDNMPWGKTWNRYLRHATGMSEDTLSALLALCDGNAPVTNWFLTKGAVIQDLMMFVISLNKLLNKQLNSWWLETPWR